MASRSSSSTHGRVEVARTTHRRATPPRTDSSTTRRGTIAIVGGATTVPSRARSRHRPMGTLESSNCISQKSSLANSPHHKPTPGGMSRRADTSLAAPRASSSSLPPPPRRTAPPLLATTSPTLASQLHGILTPIVPSILKARRLVAAPCRQ